jgi:peptidoglycan/LPS O-acetylase OafA/YrhL
VTQPALAEPHAKHRLKPLDAFRGIAIISVLLYHFTYRWGPLWPDWGPDWPKGRDFFGFVSNHAWFAQGNRGVELFFIISGFVIFMTLEHCKSGWDFAIRRFARLYPTYIFCMSATYFGVMLFGLDDFHRTVTQYLVGFTMLSDELHIGWIETACWSLQVEILFYIWVGLIYFYARRFFVPAWVGFCVFATLYTRFDSSGGFFYFGAPDLCYFTAGMAFYGVHARLPKSFVYTFFASAFVQYLFVWHGLPLSAHLLIAGAVGLFVLFVNGKLDWLGGGVLGFVGLISYPLYLLHQHLGVSLIAILDRTPWLNGWPAVAITIAAATAAAALTHYAVELPSQKFVRGLLEGWRKRRTLQTAQEVA